ncbi:MAG: type III ribulose-bisphosphate carboxylase [Candidatus Bathyarchaeota archaeon]|nr:type III ribulose-bisphosphate carboxylase [Candidatus Bathyarchaeota archaeon]
MKYRDFVDLTYRPSENDVVCDFFVETYDEEITKMAGGVAAESSIGTWTELATMKAYMKKLQAVVFDISGNSVRIAYPIELFELGNMPNMLSSVAGNVFGLKDLKNLRLNDVRIPEEIVTSFKGPKYGITGIRKLVDVYHRPLIGTIIKPKLGLNPKDHAEVAFNAWVGGCDIVKDDENLSSQKFSQFDDRVVKTLDYRDRAEEQTGEKKIYIPNVTSETNEMVKRAQFVVDQGGEYVMIDILSCGFSALQTLRDQDLNMVLHAHRAGHAAFTKNPKHGIAMRVIAKLSRIVGVDQLHVGAAVGKMSETREEVLMSCEALKGKMSKLRRVMPVASGGLHPALVPSLIDIFGIDFVIQAGGGIHGHKDGTVAGAKAMRQAVDATVEHIELEEYATTHSELQIALETWRSDS